MSACDSGTGPLHGVPVGAAPGEASSASAGARGAASAASADALRRIARSAHCLLWTAEVEDRGDERLHWELEIPDEEAAQQFLPLDVSEGITYAQAWFRSRLDDDRTSSDRYGNSRIRRSEGYSQEFRCRRRDGEVRWLWEEVEVEQIDARHWRAVGVCVDITALRTAQAALLERESRLELVLAGAGCMLWEGRAEETDGIPHWEIRLCNEAAARALLPLDTTPYRHYLQAYHQSKPPEDRERTARVALAALREGRSGYQQEFRVVQADGRVRWLWEDVRIEPMGPQRWRLVGVVLDITGRKRAEERDAAFLELGTRLNAARSTDEAGRVILAAAGALVGWDACGLRLLDDEAPAWLFMARQGDVVIEGPEAALLLEPAGPVPLPASAAPEDILEVPVRSGGRQLGWIRLRKRAPGGYSEEDRRTLQALADYGATALDRTRAEAARARLAEQFRQAQKMEAVGQLAGGIAHDFNNMLAVINGYCALLLHLVPPGGTVQEGLTDIAQAGERAAALTRQLLAFSRRQMLEPQVLRPEELLGRSTQLFQHLVGEEIRLQVVLPPNPGRILVDPGQLEQVLMNLVLNARDAMPAGGTLCLQVDNVRLRKAAIADAPELAPGWYVRFTVADTGVGMAPELTARIWEPFFTTKEPGQGTGLGLATVYGITRQSGGAATVESIPGAGSTFRVYLPRVTDAGEPFDTTDPDQHGSQTVLVCEDDPEVRARLVEALLAQGYAVMEAASDGEAVALAAGRPEAIDLLVTHTDLSDEGAGQKLAAALREHHPELGIMAVSLNGGVGGRNLTAEG